MKILFRMGAAILIAAVVFATLGPPRYRPHSPLGQDGEHALAFVLVGLAVGLVFPRRRLFVAAVSVVLIGLLEIMQLWAPGRHARLEDFLVDAVTACVGLAGAAVINWLAARGADPGRNSLSGLRERKMPPGEPDGILNVRIGRRSRPQSRPAPRAHLYLAPSSSTGSSVE